MHNALLRVFACLSEDVCSAISGAAFYRASGTSLSWQYSARSSFQLEVDMQQEVRFPAVHLSGEEDYGLYMLDTVKLHSAGG